MANNGFDLESLKKQMMGGGIKESNPSYKNGNNKQKNGKKGGNYQNRGSAQNGGYIGAPYNFVSFSKQIYQYPEKDRIAYHQLSDERFTGEISYEIIAQTPIIVDSGQNQFYKNKDGKYAIPGSTMSGLIRSHVQILGLAGFGDDIDDYALMYRNVASGAEKKRYGDILGAKQINLDNGKKHTQVGILKNVKAGYLTKEKDAYVIYKTKKQRIKKELGEMNYYVLSERKVVQAYEDAKQSGKKFPFPVFQKDGKSIMQHQFQALKKDIRTKKNGEEDIHYIGTKNDDYKPYYKKVSYKLAGEKDVIAVGYPDDYPDKGYVMSTGKMNEKKAIYIIPEMDEENKIVIPQQDVRAFQIDMEKKKNTLKQFGGQKFFDLPEAGEIKPVFYIELGGKFYFGFTPRLRLFYDASVKEGLPIQTKEGYLDYGRAIFGYSDSNRSYKSRVSFTDAVVVGTTSVLPKEQVILSDPKPSSYLDYVKQNSKEKTNTYNTEGFELRGVKQYWLRNEVLPGNVDPKYSKAASSIHPLEKGTTFAGKVRFQNLTKDELGLLLWGIRLEKNSWVNIGKAKAFGYGAAVIKITEAKQMNLKQAYLSPDSLQLQPFEKLDVERMIEAYKKHINQFLRGTEIDKLPHIREFFQMKDSTLLPDKQKIGFMKLKEYQSRKAALPSIEETIKRN